MALVMIQVMMMLERGEEEYSKQELGLYLYLAAGLLPVECSALLGA
jgi:hypothetical protein